LAGVSPDRLGELIAPLKARWINGKGREEVGKGGGKGRRNRGREGRGWRADTAKNKSWQRTYILR